MVLHHVQRDVVANLAGTLGVAQPDGHRTKEFHQPRGVNIRQLSNGQRQRHVVCDVRGGLLCVMWGRANVKSGDQ